MASSGDITRLLARIREGDDRALDELLPLVYGELRRMAGHLLRSERPDHTLQPTALVHEAYMRLVGETIPLNDRHHFFAIAARAMRRVLVEHARARGRAKRGGDRARITLSDDLIDSKSSDPIDLLALDDALEALARRDARKVRVVELIFFGGLTAAEAAGVLDVTARTVERDWAFARAWLIRAITSP
jgi:RNA polymerase sigma factor (TIGR02999 family)